MAESRKDTEEVIYVSLANLWGACQTWMNHMDGGRSPLDQPEMDQVFKNMRAEIDMMEKMWREYREANRTEANPAAGDAV